MMAAKSVLVLDDDSDLRLLLCELFASFGAKCIGVESLDEMQKLGASGRLSFDLVILDVNLGVGQPSGIDAYRWLRDQSFSGRIVFMTGHGRSFPGVLDVYAVGVRVLEKPVSVDDLLNLFLESAPQSQGDSGTSAPPSLSEKSLSKELSQPQGESGHDSGFCFHRLV